MVSRSYLGLLALLLSTAHAGDALRVDGRTAGEWIAHLKEQKRRIEAIDMRFLGSEPLEASAIRQAKRALATAGSAAVPLIEAELQQRFDPDWIEILGSIGEPAIPVLVKLLDSTTVEARDTAQKALQEQSSNAIPLLRACADADNAEISRRLTTIGDVILARERMVVMEAYLKARVPQGLYSVRRKSDALYGLELCDGREADLLFLKGAPLQELALHDHPTDIDLSKLNGMPLGKLTVYAKGLTSLSGLRNLQLQELYLSGGAGIMPVADLSPLSGMPLKTLDIYYTEVTDLTRLQGMKLEHILFDRNRVKRGLGVLRAMQTLQSINGDPPAEFWRKYSADFGQQSVRGDGKPAPQP